MATKRVKEIVNLLRRVPLRVNTVVIHPNAWPEVVEELLAKPTGSEVFSVMDKTPSSPSNPISEALYRHVINHLHVTFCIGSGRYVKVDLRPRVMSSIDKGKDTYTFCGQSNYKNSIVSLWVNGSDHVEVQDGQKA